MQLQTFLFAGLLSKKERFYPQINTPLFCWSQLSSYTLAKVGRKTQKNRD